MKQLAHCPRIKNTISLDIIIIIRQQKSCIFIGRPGIEFGKLASLVRKMDSDVSINKPAEDHVILKRGVPQRKRQCPSLIVGAMAFMRALDKCWFM